MTHVAEDCEALTESILSSAQQRQQAIADLKSGVAAFLTTNKTERLQAFRDAHDRMARQVARLVTETHQFLSQCNDEQRAVAETLRQAAVELRGLAATGEASRRNAFILVHDACMQMHNQIAKNVAELVAATRTLLHNCGVKQRTVGDEVREEAHKLRQELAIRDEARLKAFSQMHERIAGLMAGLVRDVKSRLEESHNDSLAARAAWDNLASARSKMKTKARKNG